MTDRTFTEEAKRLLEAERERLGLELEETAFNEALISRGEPVEITASDVRKARSYFHIAPPVDRSPIDLMYKLYIWVGIAGFIGGALYPMFRKFLIEADPITKTSLTISLSGLGMALFMFFFRRYYENLRRQRMKHRGSELRSTTNDRNA